MSVNVYKLYNVNYVYIFEDIVNTEDDYYKCEYVSTNI